MKRFLESLDEKIYCFLEKNVDLMPLRFIKLVAYNYTDARIRKIYLEKLGVNMGEGTYSNLGLKLALDFEKGRQGISQVEIGSYVSIAPGVTFIANESANNGKEINTLPYVRDVITRKGKIVIGNNVWIGANVTILSGVHIGECTVIGAGSVVLHDLEPYSIYAGVPAKKIRDLKL